MTWLTSPRRFSEGLPELDSERPRLVHEQARPSGRLCRDRAAVAEIGDLVGEILTDQRNLERPAIEPQVRVNEPIRRPQPRVLRLVVAAEAAPYVRVVGVAHHLPLGSELP